MLPETVLAVASLPASPIVTEPDALRAVQVPPTRSTSHGPGRAAVRQRAADPAGPEGAAGRADLDLLGDVHRGRTSAAGRAAPSSPAQLTGSTVTEAEAVVAHSSVPSGTRAT